MGCACVNGVKEGKNGKDPNIPTPLQREKSLVSVQEHDSDKHIEGAERVDYIVIGAGVGGLSTATRAAQLGKQVVLIENRAIGGTSVNSGSIPKKVMWNVSSFLEEAKIMKHYGVENADQLTLDYSQFRTRMLTYIEKLQDEYRQQTESINFQYIQGTAQFLSSRVVQVNERKLTAEHIVIASGSAPPEELGYENCMDTNDFFEMTELPKRMVVVGSGFVAVELAQILQGFGVSVTLLVRNRMLSFMDDDIHQVLFDNMQKTGLDVRLKTSVKRVLKNGDGSLNIIIDTGHIIQTDACLVALSRPPTLQGLGLDTTQIVHDVKIQVDSTHETSVKGVYAIGEVTKKCGQAPVAVREGRILAERLFNGRTDLKLNYDNIPCVCFSYPAVGACGLSEAKARQQYQDQVHVFKSTFTNLFYSPVFEDMRLESLFKVICIQTGEDNGKDARHLKVVGVQGIGKGIDEMMQGISIAINMGASKQDFDNTVAIHPTASEEFALMDPKFEDIV